MEQDELKTTTELIRRDFELEAPDEPQNERELLDLLADRIAWLLEYRLEWLMSLMYRMDVSERKVDEALSPGHPEPANVTLAKLVLERQHERWLSKQRYRQEDLGEEWEW